MESTEVLKLKMSIKRGEANVAEYEYKRMESLDTVKRIEKNIEQQKEIISEKTKILKELNAQTEGV